MAKEVFKEGNRIAKDVVRVHRGGNRIDGVSKDNELFFTDLPIPNRSKFNLSFDRKMSFEMGTLVPILAQECLPGDTFHIAQANNIQFAPLIAPMYHRVDYRTWYFFVPTRLVDDGFKDFVTQKDPTYVLPYFTGSQVYSSTSATYIDNLLDYFDLPVQQSNWHSNSRHLVVHPIRAYNLIWNEYFRDEFKQTAITVPKTGGQILTSELVNMIVRRIGWEKDYFTTCQTSPQIGSDVPLPVGLSSDSNGISFTLSDSSTPNSGTVNFNGSVDFLHDSSGSSLFYSGGLKTTGTINDLRIANHLQEYRDKMKIAGQRYNEAILAEFGVVVPDYRIQRPEYIGGFANPVGINRVMQTTPTNASPLGSYAGSAVSSGRMDYIHYNCLEHGYIIGLCSVVPRTGYDQGIPKMFMKDDLYSYYHPDFATLGDQAVLTDELFVKSDVGGNPDNTRFGYQQRYGEYKYANDRTNGEFRTNLNFWHMNREFSSAPTLDSSFIACEPTTRIFAVQSNVDHMYAEIYQEIQAIRPMPKSVQPTLTSNVNG